MKGIRAQWKGSRLGGLFRDLDLERARAHFVPRVEVGQLPRFQGKQSAVGGVCLTRLVGRIVARSSDRSVAITSGSQGQGRGLGQYLDIQTDQSVCG